MRLLRIYALHYWDVACFRVAFILPKRLVMWCCYRMLGDGPDPDKATRLGVPVDVLGQWCEDSGLYTREVDG